MNADPTPKPDEPVSTTEPASLEEQQQREKRRHAQNILDLRSVAGTAPGRRLFARYLYELGLLSSSFSLDAIEMANNEGSRAAALMIHAELKAHCPEDLVLVLQEMGRDPL